MGAPQADGLGNAKASETHSGLGPTGAIPSAGFTPGPWELGDTSGGYQEINAPYAPIAWTGLARVVVQMEAPAGLADYPQGQANARLIATAPEMLEALEDGMRSMDEGELRAWKWSVASLLRQARGDA
jgi:hypothetical protein